MTATSGSTYFMQKALACHPNFRKCTLKVEYIAVLRVATLIFGENRMAGRSPQKRMASSWLFMPRRLLLGKSTKRFCDATSNFDKCHYIRCLRAEFAAKHTKVPFSLTKRWKMEPDFGSWQTPDISRSHLYRGTLAWTPPTAIYRAYTVYRFNSRPQMWPMGLTLTITLTFEFEGQTWPWPLTIHMTLTMDLMVKFLNSCIWEWEGRLTLHKGGGSRSFMTMTMTIWWPRSGVWIYQIVTGVTSVVGVPSTHLVGSDNGLPPGRRQAIIWTNAGILLMGPLGTNFSEIITKVYIFWFKKMYLKLWSGN